MSSRRKTAKKSGGMDQVAEVAKKKVGIFTARNFPKEAWQRFNEAARNRGLIPQSAIEQLMLHWVETGRPKISQNGVEDDAVS